MTRKRRLNWGFSHHDRPVSKGYLTGAEVAFIAKQRALRASDQAIADMLGIPVGALNCGVVVQGLTDPPAAHTTWPCQPTWAPKPKARTRRPDPTTVWRSPK